MWGRQCSSLSFSKCWMYICQIQKEDSVSYIWNVGYILLSEICQLHEINSWSMWTVLMVTWMMQVTTNVAYICMYIPHIYPLNKWHLCQMWQVYLFLPQFGNNICLVVWTSGICTCLNSDLVSRKWPGVWKVSGCLDSIWTVSWCLDSAQIMFRHSLNHVLVSRNCLAIVWKVDGFQESVCKVSL